MQRHEQSARAGELSASGGAEARRGVQAEGSGGPAAFDR